MTAVTKSVSEAGESLLSKIAWTYGFGKGLTEKASAQIQKATPERLQGLAARLGPRQLPALKRLSLSNPVITKQIDVMSAVMQSAGKIGTRKAAPSA